MRNDLGLTALALATALCANAQAHVTMTPANAAPGSKIVAHFRVGHGCNGSPTTALTVTIPPGVSQVTPDVPQGWSLSTVRDNGATTAITWKGGELAPDKPGEFTATMVLPKSGGQLLFPATQICKSGQEEWKDVPMAGMTMKNPAPVLTLAAAAPVAAAGLSVNNGWFRALPGTLPAGGYFTLRNAGTAKAVLTGAESPACGMLMMHKSDDKGGMSSMDMVSVLDVPGGGSVAFAPGGYHLMCEDPKPAMKPGGHVGVTLLFQDGSRLAADFAVRNAAGK
jgi:copper(I)-binding protein